MSHFSRYETQFVSAKHLVLALNDMGFKDVEVYKDPVKLEGWLGDMRKNTAEIVVRRRYIGTASNDLGFKLNDKGRFDTLISDFDSENKLNSQWLQNLTQRYAYRVTLDMLGQQDFELIGENKGNDKSIHLTLRRMA